MALTFSNFKQSIPAPILARGRAYYAEGRVVDLELEEEDAWFAQVEGTDRYEVRITQSPNRELLCACDCPYDFGEHCKHVASVLYAIEEAFPDHVSDHAGGRAKRATGSKRRTKLDKLRETLEQIPPEKLREVVLALARDDRDLLNRLLIRLDAAGGKPANYRTLVKGALRIGRREYGFIDYQGARQAAAELNILLAQATDLLDEGRVNPAIVLYQAVLEETVEAYGEVDDSAGNLGGCIAHAIEGLRNAVDRLLPAEQQALFLYFLEQAPRREFMGFDWGWELFGIAAGLVDGQARRELLFAALDSLPTTRGGGGVADFSRKYDAERAAFVKLDVIKRLDGEAAAFAYMRGQVEHDGIRQALIKEYVARDDLAEAIRLAREGVALSEQQRYPGLVNQYAALLLDIAQRQGNETLVAALTRRLWLGSRDPRYFELLKEQMPPAEWPAVLEELIRESRHDSEAAWMLAREGLWARLLALALPDKVELTEPHRKELEARHPDEMALLYECRVEKMLKPVTNRETYRDAANLLARMKALGQGARVRQRVGAFIQQYPQRRAMIEELKRV
jgi:uncharacterized Zn finger protein